jgi:integrase
VTRRRALTKGIPHEDKIINTLLDMRRRGLYDNTIHTTSQKLNQLSKNTDLMNPQEVLTFIANHKTKNSVKQKLVDCYANFCKTNGLTFEKPKFKYEETIPIIPTTESVNKIINATSKKYVTIFTILAEIGLEGEELHTLHKNNIDTEQGIISIEGHKGHLSGTYKLKTRTIEMLREYLAKNPQEYPFPDPKCMSDAWRTARNRLANNLKQPELKKIPMKNLRNYSGAQLYYKIPDPIAVMRHLRHKKLETTMHYIRGIVIDGEEEYTVKTATNIKEATELLETGFNYIQEIDGIRLYRKRK